MERELTVAEFLNAYGAGVQVRELQTHTNFLPMVESEDVHRRIGTYHSKDDMNTLWGFSHDLVHVARQLDVTITDLDWYTDLSYSDQRIWFRTLCVESTPRETVVPQSVEATPVDTFLQEEVVASHNLGPKEGFGLIIDDDCVIIHDHSDWRAVCYWLFLNGGIVVDKPESIHNRTRDATNREWADFITEILRR